MKLKSYILAVITAVTFITISGCGGQSGVLGQDFLPKGEGNIPIGRAQGTYTGQSSVIIEMSNGGSCRTFTKNNVVYAPLLPKGITHVTITPADRLFAKYSFEYLVGADQSWNFNVSPINRVSTESIKGMEVNVIDGQVFKLGTKFDLDIQVYGVNLQDLTPSVILSGGTARLDSNSDITFTKNGNGVLTVELLGLKQDIPFTVRS